MQLTLDRESVIEIAEEIAQLIKSDKEMYDIFKDIIKPEKQRDTRVTTWVTISELQKKTGWGRSKLETWRKQGLFNYKQDAKGGKVLYDLEDVNRFLRKSGNNKR